MNLKTFTVTVTTLIFKLKDGLIAADSLSDVGLPRPEGWTVPPTIEGTKAGEKLTGNAELNIIQGNGGDDSIRGFGNPWYYYYVPGGLSSTRYLYFESLRGGNGDDVVRGGKGRDVLRGSAGRDSLFGGKAKDELFGGSGHDVLKGGAGSDILFGSDGDDVLKGGGGGEDILRGSNGDDYLVAGKDDVPGHSIDILSGGAGCDRLVGAGHHDVMSVHNGYGCGKRFQLMEPDEVGRNYMFGDQLYLYSTHPYTQDKIIYKAPTAFKLLFEAANPETDFIGQFDIEMDQIVVTGLKEAGLTADDFKATNFGDILVKAPHGPNAGKYITFVTVQDLHRSPVNMVKARKQGALKFDDAL